MIVSQDWLVRNAQRSYPVDELATTIDDSGNRLLDGILIDANIWVPKHVYSSYPLRELQYLYVSSIAITPFIVSITFLGAVEAITPVDGSAAQVEEFVPIAVLCLEKPVVPYKNHAIEPLLDGVRGWVALGSVVNDGTEHSLKFTTPQQSMLTPKAVHTFSQPPVTSLQVEDGFSLTRGDITFIGDSPLTIRKQVLSVNGEDKDCLLFELDSTKDILQNFAGPCGGRPESETCNKVPISSISGVSPDCQGNLTIEFEDITVRQKEDGTGFCLDSEVGRDEACDPNDGLPEDGILKTEFERVRPCEFSPPFDISPIDVTTLEAKFVPQSGSWFEAGGTIFGFPTTQGIEIASCIQAFPPSTESVTTRTFSATVALVTNVEGGLFVMKEGFRSIIVRNGDLVGTSTFGEEQVFGSVGISPLVVGVDRTINGLAIPDIWWRPSGLCGVYFKAVGALAGTPSLTAFTVVDV